MTSLEGTRAAGLRLQIVIALGALMVLAFVPLFFAVANLTRASAYSAREQELSRIASIIGAHVFSKGDGDLVETLRAERRGSDVAAICVYSRTSPDGVCEGDAAQVATMRQPRPPYADGVRRTSMRTMEASKAYGDRVIAVRIRDDDSVRAGSLVKLAALYITIFAIALLTFAYFVLTRLIVRPVDALARAADRVATGARSFAAVRAGARELQELGASLQAMTTRLVADETAMRAKVEELTRATQRLSETRAQLIRSERLASVGRLAAGIAHEIGNPIAAITGFQELLLDGDLDDATARDFLTRMRRETDRVHKIVRDLLDFARPTQPGAAEKVLPIDVECAVRDVVRDVVDLVGPQRGFKSVRIETQFGAGRLIAHIEAQHLRQVLLNLVLNAGDALASVGDEREPRVIIAATEVDGRVIVSVADNGPGIRGSLRDSGVLFEPFVTTKDVGKGTGLGLAVCRGMVEAAGGEIELDATHTPGARLVVTLHAAKHASS